MDEKSYQALLDAMGDIPLETRLGLLFLQAAGADGEVSDEELEGVSEYLGEVLEAMGLRLEPGKVLKHSRKHLENEKLLEETTELLGQHLSKAALAGIVARLEEVMSADDLSEDEESFLDELVELWQIAESGEDEEEEEDEDEEEDDEDEEDEEER